MTQNAMQSRHGTQGGRAAAAPLLEDVVAHPLVCAALRLMARGACGVDISFEQEDGAVHTVDATIASEGRRLRILQREDAVRVMVELGLPFSAVPALAGRPLSDVVDLPEAAGTGWRRARISSASIMDEDGVDMLTIRLAAMTEETVGRTDLTLQD